MLYNVLGGHIISHIAVLAEMWKTQGKSLKAQAIYINSAQPDHRDYSKLELQPLFGVGKYFWSSEF